MTRAASLGGVRGPLPSVHAERLVSRIYVITGESRPGVVQSQLFSSGRTRGPVRRRLIAPDARKVPLPRPNAVPAPAAIPAPGRVSDRRRTHAADGVNARFRRGCISTRRPPRFCRPSPSRHSAGGRARPRRLRESLAARTPGANDFAAGKSRSPPARTVTAGPARSGGPTRLPTVDCSAGGGVRSSGRLRAAPPSERRPEGVHPSRCTEPACPSGPAGSAHHTITTSHHHTITPSHLHPFTRSPPHRPPRRPCRPRHR